MIKSILLAEDDRGTAVLVKSQLEKFGYFVSVAENGRVALSIIRSQKIDLLVTDVVMPEMDGVDLYLALKEDTATAGLPIIIITDKQVFKDSFSALGVQHFLPKSSDIAQLVEKIKSIGASPVDSAVYHKIMIYGVPGNSLGQMVSLLQSARCLVTPVTGFGDLMSKLFIVNPHLLFLDVALREQASVGEIVRALKCFSVLNKTEFVTYMSFDSLKTEEMTTLAGMYEDDVRDVLKAGVRKHLGRFNRASFLDDLADLGIRR